MDDQDEGWSRSFCSCPPCIVQIIAKSAQSKIGDQIYLLSGLRCIATQLTPAYGVDGPYMVTVRGMGGGKTIYIEGVVILTEDVPVDGSGYFPWYLAISSTKCTMLPPLYIASKNMRYIAIGDMSSAKTLSD